MSNIIALKSQMAIVLLEFIALINNRNFMRLNWLQRGRTFLSILVLAITGSCARRRIDNYELINN